MHLSHSGVIPCCGGWTRCSVPVANLSKHVDTRLTDSRYRGPIFDLVNFLNSMHNRRQGLLKAPPLFQCSRSLIKLIAGKG